MTTKLRAEPTVKELIDEVLVEQSFMALTKKFTQSQLEQVLDYYTSQRIILIERKETESSGFEIERINGDISNIKLEITKINKAIAELKKKPKKTRPQIEINLEQSDLNEDELALIKRVESCRTIPEIQLKFTTEQLEFAKTHYNNVRQVIIFEKNKPENIVHDASFNLKLQGINNQISKINKAIGFQERDAAKKIKQQVEQPKPESSIVFLKKFYELAKLSIDSESFEKIKASALAEKPLPKE